MTRRKPTIPLNVLPDTIVPIVISKTAPLPPVSLCSSTQLPSPICSWPKRRPRNLISRLLPGHNHLLGCDDITSSCASLRAEGSSCLQRVISWRSPPSKFHLQCVLGYGTQQCAVALVRQKENTSKALSVGSACILKFDLHKRRILAFEQPLPVRCATPHKLRG